MKINKFMGSVLVCLLLATYVVQAEPIAIGAFVVKPYIYEEVNNLVTGAVVEYYNRFIFPKMDLQPEWTIYNVARLTQQIKSNAIGMIPILTRTKEREEFLVFSETSFVKFDPNLVVLEDSPLKTIQTQEDLFGMIIGWTKGGAYPDFLKHEKITIDEVAQLDWETGNLEKLAKKRINAAFFSNSATPQYYAQVNQLKIKIVPLPTPPIVLYAAFSLTQKSLRDRHDKIIQNVLKEHDFNTFLKETIKQMK